MYQDLHYVASVDDEETFRNHLAKIGLYILPERADGPAGLTSAEIEQARSRLLSLRPVKDVAISYTDPYPHYSPAAQPLIEWNVPQIKGKLIITGHLRHHPYMARKGPAFVKIGDVYKDIQFWMKANWRPINRYDFMGPGAAKLIEKEGYTWSCFDPEHTSFAIVRADGTEESVSFDELKDDGDR